MISDGHLMEKQMQLLQVLRLLDMVTGLFGLKDLEDLPLMRDMICCRKWPPSGDALVVLPELLLCRSSDNKLLSGVWGLPLFLPWPFFLCRPFSGPFSPLSDEAVPALESISPLLNEAEAEGTWWSSEDMGAPGDGEWRKTFAAAGSSSRPGVPRPPLEYASACSSHSLSWWELEKDGLARMEMEEGARRKISTEAIPEGACNLDTKLRDLSRLMATLASNMDRAACLEFSVWGHSAF